ncbi:MAG: porin [Planctomycetota bacterium]|jgi:hypothetical protein
MMNPIRFGLAVAVTASLGFANGDGVSKDGNKAPLLDNLFDSGAKVSYTPGSGMTFSAQDASAFSINISGQVQPGFTYAWGEDISDVSSFGLKTTRLRFAGNVYNDDVTYFLQLDAADGGEGNGNVVDAWAAWRVMDGINIRFGQQKMRSSLQADASLSDTDTEMAYNAAATSFFAGRRSTGVLVEGNSGNINWHAGAMNNSTAGFEATGSQLNESNELDFTFGANYSSDGTNTEGWSEGDLDHSGNLSYIAGANLLIGNDQSPFLPAPSADNDSTTLNLFAGVKTGSGIAVQAELFSRSDDDGTNELDHSGFYAQASYTLAPGQGTQWGGVVRVSSIDIDGFGTQSEFALGANAYYHKHKLKTQVMLTFANVDPDAGSETDATALDILFTLMF